MGTICGAITTLIMIVITLLMFIEFGGELSNRKYPNVI
jgi:hypothetical protein